MQDALQRLRENHPWPTERPDLPDDWMGWLCPETAAALISTLPADARLYVECGTWLGVSARGILEASGTIHVVCIDTWLGSPEHWADTGEWNARLPTLCKQCQANLWPWRDRVTMVPADSLVGLGQVYAVGLTPDMIYLDSKHTPARVLAELALCDELFPTSRIVGDDYNNPAVAVGADGFAAISQRPLVSHTAAFVFERR